MGTEIVQVPFHGDTLDALRDERGVWVGVKRACENVRLDSDAQVARLKRQPWAVTSVMEATGSDGKTYKMTFLHLDCLPMWLATIEASRVKEEIRPKLIAYQKECARVLRDHFFPSQAPALDIQTVAAIVSASIQPVVVMMGQILDRCQARSFDDNTIGTRGAAIIRAKLTDYATALAPDDKKLRRSLRSAAEMDLRVALQHTGTGRTWASLESSKWESARAKLEELSRLAVRVNPRQQQLAVVR